MISSFTPSLLFLKFCYKKNPLLSNKEECGKLDIVRVEKTNVCG